MNCYTTIRTTILISFNRSKQFCISSHEELNCLHKMMNYICVQVIFYCYNIVQIHFVFRSNALFSMHPLIIVNWICVPNFFDSVPIHLRIRSNKLFFIVLVYLYYVHTYLYCRTNEPFSEPGFACVR